MPLSPRAARVRLLSCTCAFAVACLLAGAVTPPALADGSAGPTYVVQPGDTLSLIATEAGVSLDELVSLNHLSSADSLTAGQVLQLPPGATVPTPAPSPTPTPASAAPATPASTPAPSATSTTYTVQPGDALWQIAAHFGVSAAAIQQANGLSDPNSLVVGSQLVIPAPSASSASPSPVPASTTTPGPSPSPSATSSAAPSTPAPTPPGGNVIYTSYTVQPGESLSQVAQKFNTTAGNLAQINNLPDPNVVVAGTILKVPVPARQHVVQAGETLGSIAAEEKVDLGSLVDDNSLNDPSTLQVGEVILVPDNPNADVQQAASSTSTTPGPSPTAPSPTAPATATATPAPTSAPSLTPGPKATPTGTATSAATPSATVAPAHTSVATPVGAPPVHPVATLPSGAPTSGLAGVALHYLGDPYVWGGASPAGFDCSGFVWYVYQQIGRTVPRSLFGEYNLSNNHPAVQALQVSDLVFFQDTYTSGLSHSGIYIGNGLFVHAANEQWGVTISSLASDYWTAHWFGATRA